MILTKRLLAPLALLTLTITGCGSPTIDASSAGALAASIKKINRSLSEPDQLTFAKDCSTIIFPDALRVAARNDIQRAWSRALADPTHFKPLHGLTASQVHDKAEQSRWDAEQNRAMGLAPDDRSFAMVGAQRTNEAPKSDPTPKSEVAEPFEKVKPIAPHLIPDPDWIGIPGEEATLFDPNKQSTYVAADLIAWGELVNHSNSQNNLGLADLLKRGRTFIAEHGTAVSILAKIDDLVTSKGIPVMNVRLLDGEHAGRSVWVAKSSVVRLTDTETLAEDRAARAEEDKRRYAEREKAKARANSPQAKALGLPLAGQEAQAQASAKPGAPARPKEEWDSLLSNIYPLARKALAEARNRGNQASTAAARKIATKREIEEAARKLCVAYELSRAELDRLMIEGQAMEDREKAKKAASGKK